MPLFSVFYPNYSEDPTRPTTYEKPLRNSLKSPGTINARKGEKCVRFCTDANTTHCVPIVDKRRAEMVYFSSFELEQIQHDATSFVQKQIRWNTAHSEAITRVFALGNEKSEGYLLRAPTEMTAADTSFLSRKVSTEMRGFESYFSKSMRRQRKIATRSILDMQDQLSRSYERYSADSRALILQARSAKVSRQSRIMALNLARLDRIAVEV